MTFAAVTGEFAKVMGEVTRPIAEAGTAAMDDVAADIKERGRVDIIAGGLGRKWANALRVTRFPKRGIALGASVFAVHRIGYADVFEQGLTIAGKPLLWVPLETTLKRVAGKRVTPELIAQRFGDLISINRPGRPPLLAARAKGRISAKTRQVSGRQLAAGGRGEGALLPLFVGVPSVKEKKRTRLMQVFSSAAGRLASRFNAHFKG